MCLQRERALHNHQSNIHMLLLSLIACYSNRIWLSFFCVFVCCAIYSPYKPITIGAYKPLCQTFTLKKISDSRFKTLENL